MKVLKNNKGITLVALVVTIIVLIILAGVSISLVLGQDGVVQKAKAGRDNYADAARLENEQLANVDAFAINIGEVTSSETPVTGTITNMTGGDLTLTATVNLEGNIDLTRIKYVFTTSSDPIGTNDETLYKDGVITQANETITKSKAAGTYYLHILTVSNNGVKTEIVSDTTAISQGKKDFNYTGNVQEVALQPGNYKLEVWGAEGGSRTPTGGKGGYSYGNLSLNEPITIYSYVGQAGFQSASSSTGSYNGGGGCNGSNCQIGGGGTDFCTIQSSFTTGTYVNYRSNDSYLSRIIVAGGGGASGYSTSNGGAGGGTSGLKGATSGYEGLGGTQTSGGGRGSSSSQGSNGSFGYGGYSYDNDGSGGGGWYGGGRR